MSIKFNSSYLKELRDGHKWNVRELQDEILKITDTFTLVPQAQTILLWEKGEICPNIVNLFLLSKVYNVSMQDFIIMNNKDN